MILTFTVGANISLPVTVSGKYFVDFGDGTLIASIRGNVLGTGIVKIYGTITSVGIGSANTAWVGLDSLTAVTSWGQSAITSLSGAFNCGDNPVTSILTSVASIPPSVVDTSYMFKGATFNGDISNWDVSGVTNMQYMFINAASFTAAGLHKWTLTACTSFEGMFRGTSAAYTSTDASGTFIEDLSSWRKIATHTLFFSPNGSTDNSEDDPHSPFFRAQTLTLSFVDTNSFTISANYTPPSTLGGKKYFVGILTEGTGGATTIAAISSHTCGNFYTDSIPFNIPNTVLGLITSTGSWPAAQLIVCANSLTGLIQSNILAFTFDNIYTLSASYNGNNTITLSGIPGPYKIAIYSGATPSSCLITDTDTKSENDAHILGGAYDAGESVTVTETFPEPGLEDFFSLNATIYAYAGVNGINIYSNEITLSPNVFSNYTITLSYSDSDASNDLISITSPFSTVNLYVGNDLGASISGSGQFTISEVLTDTAMTSFTGGDYLTASYTVQSITITSSTPGLQYFTI